LWSRRERDGEREGGMRREEKGGMKMRNEEEGGMRMRCDVGKKIRKVRDTKEDRGLLIGTRGTIRSTGLRRSNSIISSHVKSSLLCCATLYTVPYHTILYYTIPYHTKLYYTILF
jgi:hypothetical protein